MDLFYLGSHVPSWLSRADVPLFVSRRLLHQRKTFPRAKSTWALDSGGFTELNLHGKWSVSAKQYASEVKKFSTEIGNLAWASPQDWMCESVVLAKTGLTVKQHQINTVHNYLELMLIDDTLPWVPVLQGWSIDDYQRCIELYDTYGIDLSSQQLVAVGSVCRRSHTDQAGEIFKTLHSYRLRLHGYGLKIRAMQKYKQYVHSADSLAWSYAARYDKPIAGHTHKNCANCMEYALNWYYNKIQRVIE